MQLTRFKYKNIPDVLSWINNESQMVQWAGPIFRWPLTQKQFRDHLTAAKTEYPTLYSFGLYDGAKIIGYCELSSYHRKANSAIASRIIISPRRRNKGLGRGMTVKLLEFGFNELCLNRVGLGVFDFNKFAIKCYQNVGFVLEGKLREAIKVNGTYWDCCLMSILQKEWSRNQK